jgi:hypothetical protein
MPKLSMYDLRKFTSKVDQTNFLIFAKLLNLTDQDLFNLVIELLNDNRINLFMLSGLPMISDHTVKNFVESYLIHVDPQVLHTSNVSDFSVSDYMEGLKDGANVTTLIDLLRAYNAQENLNYGKPGRKLIGDIKLTLDRSSYFGYNSLQDIKTVFDQHVNSDICNEFQTIDIQYVFPTPQSLPTPNSDRATAVRTWYSDVFSPFLGVLNNQSLHGLLYSVDETMAKSQEYVVEFHEIYNFKLYGDNIPKLHNQTAFELAALGRPYNDAEIAAIEESIYSTSIVPTSLSESISLKLYKAHIVALHKGYAGDAAYASKIIDDLEVIIEMIEHFKKVVNMILNQTHENFKVVT